MARYAEDARTRQQFHGSVEEGNKEIDLRSERGDPSYGINAHMQADIRGDFGLFYHQLTSSISNMM